NVTEENGYVNIIVSDTGCGITKEDLPFIMTKFFKANLTRRGSGIGLAVANEIVKMHDGKITIDSEINIGTTVTVSLPVNLKKGETRQTEISNGKI
ncbi:MAG: HAMP domain-containing sensor histidine kinase, partial [Oscillospiraceae bacterium]